MNRMSLRLLRNRICHGLTGARGNLRYPGLCQRRGGAESASADLRDVGPYSTRPRDLMERARGNLRRPRLCRLRRFGRGRMSRDLQ